MALLFFLHRKDRFLLYTENGIWTIKAGKVFYKRIREWATSLALEAVLVYDLQKAFRADRDTRRIQRGLLTLCFESK